MASTKTDERRLVTAEEFERMEVSESADLVYGVIEEYSEEEKMPTVAHGWITLTLGQAIRHATGGKGLTVAEAAFKLSTDPDLTRRPDVSYVSERRLDDVDIFHGHPPVSPDLAVEVLSPGDRADKIAQKIREYLEHGVRLVWIIDPFQRYVVAHTPSAPPRLCPAGSTLDGGDVLPDFSVPVDDLLPPE